MWHVAAQSQCGGMSALGGSGRAASKEKVRVWVESRCGAVALGRTYLLPPLSSGGALVVRPWLRFHIPLIGRVEDWRAGVGRSLCSLLSRPFVCECHTISTMPRFQPPPRRTQRADFPHYALLFASPQGLWDLSCRSDFRHRSPNPVAVEQPQGFVQPLPTPPLPAEALSVLSTHHMAPDLLFYPVLDEAEALAGMPNREVVHPTAQDRVDQLHDPIHWLRLVAAEHVLELPQQAPFAS